MQPVCRGVINTEVPPKQSILVVGASGSIGSGVAQSLAFAGFSVGLHYCNNSTAVKDLSELLQRANCKSIVLQCDLSSIAECDGLVERFASVVDEFYGIALCAGRVPWKAWQETDETAWQSVYCEHCIIPFGLARSAQGKLSPGGRIVYLSSISAKYGGSDATIHYAASKAALETSMKGLARELAPSDILVNGVRAGFVDTPQQRLGRSQSVIDIRIGKIPLQRAGTTAEIGSAFTYLFSPGAAFITGEILTVAGGD